MSSRVGSDVGLMGRPQPLLAGQDWILELIATGAPLESVLSSLARLSESQTGGICSILLLDQEGTRRESAGSRFSKVASEIPEPLQSGPGGTRFSMACSGEPVIVTDFLADPRWADYRELVSRYGLRACWSTPFCSHYGKVLGTFAMYYSRPGRPNSSEIEVLEGAARLAAVAVERWQGDTELRRAADNYRDLVENLNEIVFSLDVDGNVTYISPPIEGLSGYRTGEMTGKPFAEFVHPDDRQLMQDCLADVLVGKLKPCEFRIVDRKGLVHWCRSSSRPQVVRDQLVGITSIIVDITEQRKTQEALQLAEQSYQAIFEEAVVGIFRTAPEGQYVVVNPALARMLGYDSPEEVKASITDVARQLYVDPDRRREFKSIIEKEGSVRGFECQVYRKNGGRMWMSVNARAIYKNGRTVAYEGMNEDITERKLLQQQVLQAQRLDAVGKLAGGIAHDFNNLLGVVLGQGELLLDRLSFADPSRRRVEQICQAAQRAVALTAQLLAFGRQQILHPVVLDLNAVLRNLNDIMARVIGEDIVLVNRHDPALGPVKGDVGQIEQVLLNLAVNARDAMSQGGTLTVETCNVDLDTNAQRYAGAGPGRYALLTMTDTGTGMDEETMAQIFEPFFTTKERDRGTGLGLATVYGIVKQSGGYISVSSELGVGTTFSVYLPRTDESLTVESPAGSPLASQESRCETILLVEDSDPLRGVTREFLQSAGYHVLETHSPEQALELAKECQSPICLVITDVVMPGMNGRVLAERLRERQPRMKVLYVSGYTDEAVFRCGVRPGKHDFLNKPFTRDGLLNRVREVLKAPS
jgi:two-component system, cell cycle sensor histidine kinase and response regulator CckA